MLTRFAEVSLLLTLVVLLGGGGGGGGGGWELPASTFSSSASLRDATKQSTAWLATSWEGERYALKGEVAADDAVTADDDDDGDDEDDDDDEGKWGAGSGT